MAPTAQEWATRFGSGTVSVILLFGIHARVRFSAQTTARWIQGVPKIGTIFIRLTFIKLTDFRNCFTVRIRRKFAIIPSLKIPPHLKCVATLPCKMSQSGVDCRSISLIMPLVTGIASLNASSGQQQGKHIEHFDVKTAECDNILDNNWDTKHCFLLLFS